MKRFLATALVAFLGVPLMASDALARKRHRGWHHHRRHRVHFRHHYRFYFPLIHFIGYPFVYLPYRVYDPYWVPIRRRAYVVVENRTFYPPAIAYPGIAHQATGTILGGIAGGVIGSQIGGGRGRTVATIAGSIIGALLGADIGRQLDERDLLLFHARTQYALERVPSGYVVGWRSTYTGNSGTIVPRPAYRIPQGRYCREFQQTVTVGGRTVQAYGTACRQPDGSWQIVP